MEEEELAIFLVTFTGVANPALVPLARHGGVYAGLHCTSGSLWGRSCSHILNFCILFLCLLQPSAQKTLT